MEVTINIIMIRSTEGLSFAFF